MYHLCIIRIYRPSCLMHGYGLNIPRAVSYSTRDAVAEYRDIHNLPNYNAALRQLLKEAGASDTLSAEVESHH